MNKLMHEQIHELLAKSESRGVLECERALRVGAATLWQVPSGHITAMTVVCDIAEDRINALESLVADIAEEFGLDGSIKRQPGACSVRFSWPEHSEPVRSRASEKSLLRRLLAR